MAFPKEQLVLGALVLSDLFAANYDKTFIDNKKLLVQSFTATGFGTKASEGKITKAVSLRISETELRVVHCGSCLCETEVFFSFVRVCGGGPQVPVVLP